MAIGDAVFFLHRGNVGRCQLRSVVVDMSGNRQSPALDRVGHDDNRSALDGFRLGKRVKDLLHVVTAEIHQQVLERGIRYVSKDAAHFHAGRLPPLDHGAADFPSVRVQQRLVLGVAAGIDPPAQALTVRPFEEFQLLAAVLEPQHLPALGLEQAGDLQHLAFRGNVVEALTVDVDDPPQVVKAVGARLPNGFRDVAFVDLGVTHQGDIAPLPVGPAKVVAHVALCQRPENRCGSTEADRAGGDGHAHRVLGAAGVGLQAPEITQGGQHVARQVAKQVLDGVKDRRGMRLHRHVVLRPQYGEIQRRHQVDRRGAARLMPAHLEAVRIGANLVGVVDHVGREPQDALRDRFQTGNNFGVGRVGGR